MQSDFCAELYSGLENNDIIGLAWYENGFFDVLSKKEVDVPSDFNGMNIRTMENAAYMNTYTAAGANPVPMAFSEVYTALQNGTVDGVSTSITASVPMKFYEVAPYFLQVDMQFAICNMIFSKEVLDEMPQEYQDLIKECAIESQQYEWDQIAIQEQEGINTINASGGQVKATTDKQAWINAVRDPVYSSSAHADKIDHIRNYDH